MAERKVVVFCDDEGKVGRAKVGEKPEATRLNCSNMTKDSCGKVLRLMVIDVPWSRSADVRVSDDEEETSSKVRPWCVRAQIWQFATCTVR